MNIMYHSISSSHGGPVQGPSPVHMYSVIVFRAYTHVLLVGRGLKTPVWWQPLHGGSGGIYHINTFLNGAFKAKWTPVLL